MQTDPASLDPEERTNKWLALFSAALGVLSIPGAWFSRLAAGPRP